MTFETGPATYVEPTPPPSDGDGETPGNDEWLEADSLASPAIELPPVPGHDTPAAHGPLTSTADLADRLEAITDGVAVDLPDGATRLDVLAGVVGSDDYGQLISGGPPEDFIDRGQPDSTAEKPVEPLEAKEDVAAPRTLADIEDFNTAAALRDAAGDDYVSLTDIKLDTAGRPRVSGRQISGDRYQDSIAVAEAQLLDTVAELAAGGNEVDSMQYASMRSDLGLAPNGHGTLQIERDVADYVAAAGAQVAVDASEQIAPGSRAADTEYAELLSSTPEADMDKAVASAVDRGRIKTHNNRHAAETAARAARNAERLKHETERAARAAGHETRDDAIIAAAGSGGLLGATEIAELLDREPSFTDLDDQRRELAVLAERIANDRVQRDAIASVPSPGSQAALAAGLRDMDRMSLEAAVAGHAEDTDSRLPAPGMAAVAAALGREVDYRADTPDSLHAELTGQVSPDIDLPDADQQREAEGDTPFDAPKIDHWGYGGGAAADWLPEFTGSHEQGERLAITAGVAQENVRGEDAYLVNEDLGLYVVADGAGGTAGDGSPAELAVLASQGVERFFIADYPEPSTPEGAAELMRSAFLRARQDVVDSENGSATTLRAAKTFTIEGVDYLVWGNAGDSLMYVSDADNRLTMLGTDQSEMVGGSDIFVGQSTLMNAIDGMAKSVDGSKDEFGYVEMQPDMSFIMASDGVWGDIDTQMLSNEEILRILGTETAQEGAELAIVLSKKHDDTTAIVIHADSAMRPQDSATPPPHRPVEQGPRGSGKPVPRWLQVATRLTNRWNSLGAKGKLGALVAGGLAVAAAGATLKYGVGMVNGGSGSDAVASINPGPRLGAGTTTPEALSSAAEAAESTADAAQPEATTTTATPDADSAGSTAAEGTDAAESDTQGSSAGSSAADTASGAAESAASSGGPSGGAGSVAAEQATTFRDAVADAVQEAAPNAEVDSLVELYSTGDMHVADGDGFTQIIARISGDASGSGEIYNNWVGANRAELDKLVADRALYMEGSEYRISNAGTLDMNTQLGRSLLEEIAKEKGLSISGAPADLAAEAAQDSAADSAQVASGSAADAAAGVDAGAEGTATASTQRNGGPGGPGNPSFLFDQDAVEATASTQRNGGPGGPGNPNSTELYDWASEASNLAPNSPGFFDQDAPGNGLDDGPVVASDASADLLAQIDAAANTTE